MEQEINRFTAYTNCPSGEYWAVFYNSEVKKYPKGKREVLSFLILNDDKETPRLNNKEEPYYSTIICNESKGSSPKSKVNKIKKSMLSKEEYDPISIHLGVPTIETFYNRKLKVKVSLKSNNKNFITHIQRPRDNQWESIEGEFEGKFITTTDPIELYYKLRNKIPNKERVSYDEAIDSMVNANMKVLLDENGKFKMDIDYNHKDMYGSNSSISMIHKKLLKFIESQDLKTLFPELKIR